MIPKEYGLLLLNGGLSALYGATSQITVDETRTHVFYDGEDHSERVGCKVDREDTEYVILRIRYSDELRQLLNEYAQSERTL